MAGDETATRTRRPLLWVCALCAALALSLAVPLLFPGLARALVALSKPAPAAGRSRRQR